MSRITDQNYLKAEQYKTASNLNARIQLHVRFSTNPYGWFRWVFDQYNLPAKCRVLELGCGPADIWRANKTRIPEGWKIVLSDFSEGMVTQARENLEGLPRIDFQCIDAQSIPFEDGQFDAVIANHMLYHVPDRRRALREIRRVLAPGGTFFATTVGEKHLQELLELPYRFDPHYGEDPLKLTHEFSLESGPQQLQEHFTRVITNRYPDSLHITEAAPLVDFILSSFRFNGLGEKQQAFQAFVQQALERNGGALDITKDSGILIAS